MTAVAEPIPSSFNSAFSRYLAATRLPFLSATLVACLIGLASVSYSGVKLNVFLAVTTLLLALLVHAAVNVLNDYFDALNGTDDANTDRLFPFTGGSRFIQNGILTRVETARFGYAMLVVAIAGGLWLATRVGNGLLLIGAFGVFTGWAYSAAPLKLNSRGLGELCVLAGFLGIVVGTDFVQRGIFDPAPALIGLPYALLVTNLLYINQFPDRKADAAAAKNHWVVRLPLAFAVRVYPLLSGLALGILLMLHQREMIPAVALLSALPLLLSLPAAAILKRHASRPAALLSAIHLTIAAMLAHGILLSVLLVWNRS